MSNPSETKLLKKEENCYKLHGKDERAYDQPPQEKGDKFEQFASFMQSLMTPARCPRTTYAPRPFSGYPRQMPTQNRFRFRPQYTGCFICGDPREDAGG